MCGFVMELSVFVSTSLLHPGDSGGLQMLPAADSVTAPQTAERSYTACYCWRHFKQEPTAAN